jgi:acyl-CoA dehydrogenase
VNGIRLINHQWAQIMLSEMYKNVNAGRAAMVESVYAIAMYGLLSALYSPPFYYLQLFLPRWFFTLFVSPFLGLKVFTRLFRKIYLYWRPKDEIEIQSGWASLSKVACGDIGVINSHMAVELMGIDGCRHDIGAEKYLRDAKLSQIYEGTQQLNRLNIFMSLVARNMPEVEVF